MNSRIRAVAVRAKAVAVQAAQSNTVLIIGNILAVIVEILALAINQTPPLPIINQDALPWLIFIHAALNIIARQFLQPKEDTPPTLFVKDVSGMTKKEQEDFVANWQERIK